MFFAANFDIFIPIRNAKMLEMNIVIIIAVNSWFEIVFKISFTATAVPERVLFILYIVINPNAETIVFIAPTKNRKERLSCWNISEPIVAAWPEPIPGRNEQRGADIAAAKNDFKNCFFLQLYFF